jgi:hypothetical protein
MLKLLESTIVDELIPKEKIYAQADISSKVKRLFVQQIEKIVWLAKISPNTMNITADNDFPELDIIEFKLRTPNFNMKIMETVDTVIPRPVLFRISFSGQSKYAIAYKEPAAKGENRTKVIEYFQTAWLNENETTLTVEGNSVKAVYENFLKQIDSRIKLPPHADLKTAVAEMREIQKIRQEIDMLTARIAKEPQDNKRHELAKKRYELEQKIKSFIV